MIGGHAGPDDPIVDLGHERTTHRCSTQKREEPAPVAPAAVDHHLGGRLDVLGPHRADRSCTSVMRRRPVVGYHRRMATLSRDDVEHVAHLARLGLTDDELTRLEGQLNHILDQYAMLAELDTEAIAPTAQTIELENILRDDVVDASLPVEDVLANAPERRGDFIVVPAILGGDDARPA